MIDTRNTNMSIGKILFLLSPSFFEFNRVMMMIHMVDSMQAVSVSCSYLSSNTRSLGTALLAAMRHALAYCSNNVMLSVGAATM